MEDTAKHETVYELAHRADKAKFSLKSDPAILTCMQSGSDEKKDKVYHDNSIFKAFLPPSQEVFERKRLSCRSVAAIELGHVVMGDGREDINKLLGKQRVV